MNRLHRTAAALVLTLLVAASAFGEDAASARGFNPASLYHYGDIDNINLFNGNMILLLPIGQGYAINKSFGYQLTLNYNSKAWDLSPVARGEFNGCSEGVLPDLFYVPNRTSNAGIGWSLGYGRFFPACNRSVEASFAEEAVYQSPDGASHQFTGTGNVRYTTDGSRIRARNIDAASPGPVYVDLPDGTTYEYTKNGCKEWLLSAISDPFLNFVHITWDTPGLTETISDAYGRNTVIHYKVADKNDTYDRLVDYVDVPVFSADPNQQNTKTATYIFHYAYPRLTTFSATPNCYPLKMIVPHLTGIDLPDGSTYGMEYGNGVLTTLTLPTKGKIDWRYQSWEIPGPPCELGSSFPLAVAERTFTDPHTGRSETWHYTSELPYSPFDQIAGYCPFLSPSVVGIPPKEEKRTIVTSPRGDKTIHYFSVFTGRSQYDPAGADADSPNGFKRSEFGLPFTHLQARPGLALNLSTKAYDCGGTGACDDAHPDITTYVDYQSVATAAIPAPPDTAMALPRQSRQYFEKDLIAGEPRYVDATQSDYDGYWHFRTVTTTGNLGLDGAMQSRTVTTNYNGAEAEVGSNNVRPASGTWDPATFQPFPETERWILDTYTSITTQENGVTSKQLYLFDKNGFLRRTRVRKGVLDQNGRYTDNGNGINDLITVYEPTTFDPPQWTNQLQAAGDVASDTKYGGDVTPLANSSASLEDFPLSGGLETKNTYRYGTLAASRITGAPFQTVSVDVDRNTGEARTVTDPAGHQKTFDYDNMGRLKTETAPTGTYKSYLYNNATDQTGASATESVFAAGTTSTPVQQTTYSFDGFGRVVKSSRLLADNSYSEIDTAWNVFGQKVSETLAGSLGSPGPATTYAYDASGRLLTATPPAGPKHAINSVYFGARKKTTTYGGTDPQTGLTGGIGTTIDAAGNVTEEPMSRSEEHDTFGRLVRLTETSAPNVSTTATYAYDAADHVSTVTVVAPEGSQTRNYLYDNLGYLRSVQQPEDGLTSYDTYDVSGHPLHKLQGASGGLFDLTFTYDIVQRLTDVKQGNTVIKHVTYDSLPPGDPEGTIAETGAVVKTYRRNYHAALGGDVGVSTYLHYDQYGRISDKKTVIANGPSFAQSYTYDLLNDIVALDYPKCTGCGTASIPDRTISYRWAHGFLTGVDQGTTHYTSADPTKTIGYWPNGMTKSVTHTDANGGHDVVDSQTLDNSLSRPAMITFSGMTDCPLITGVTGDGSVLSGATAHLNVATSGTNLTFQWYAGDSGDLSHPLQNGSNAAYDTTALTAESHFWVRVGDGTCFASSRTVIVTIRTCVSLSITEEPADMIIQSGQVAQFSVTASDSSAHYQWYRGTSGDTTNPVGSDASSFTTPLLTASTTYWVRVRSSDNLCTVDSGTANAHVCVPAAILVQPQSKLLPAANPPATVTVSTSIEVAGENPSIDWYDDDTGAIVGHDRTLSVDFAPGAPVRKFHALVTNTVLQCAGSAESVHVTLGVGDCIKIGSQTGLVTVYPGNNTFPLMVAVTGTNADHTPSPFHYEWHHVLNDGTDVDLTAIDPSQWNKPQITGALNAPYDSYYCVVTSTECPGLSVTSNRIYVHYHNTCPLPPLSVTPTSADVTGGSQTFTAYCDWPNVSYQWYIGASGDTRHKLNTGKTYIATNAGVIWVRVTDECGINHEDSPSLVITAGSCKPVVINTQPQSLDINAGERPTLHVDAANATSYTWYEDGSSTPLGSGKDFTPITGPTETTSYVASISNSCFSTISLPGTLHVKRCSDITVSAQPVGGTIRSDETTGFDLSVTASATGTISYKWYQGESGDTSTPVPGATLSSLHVLPDTTTSYWVRITTTSCKVDSETAIVTVCVPPHFTNANTPMTYELRSGQSVAFSVQAAGTGLHYAWHTGSPTGPVEGSDSEQLLVHPFDSTVYYCVITGTCASITSSPVTVHVCDTPVIDTQPQSTTVFSGRTVTLTVHATEGKTTPIVYQWGDSAGNLVGTNSPTFTTPPITDTKQYSVLLTAGICTVESSVATINVCTLPEIIGSGGDVNVAAGQQVTLHAGLISPPNGNTYVWYRGAVGDTTSPVYSSTSTDAYTFTATASAQYWATISRDDGCVSHTPAYLVNVCVPVISAPPQDTLYDLVNPAVLSVSATPATGYQWYIGQSGDTSNLINGATSSSISVTPASDTRYWVRVSSSCTSVDSASALVTHCIPPAITGQPVDRSITYGQQTTLTVYATGTQLHYQWYQGASGTTTTPVGSDAATISLSPASPADYWVRVSGGCSAAQNSAAAHVSVCTAPSITAQPSAASVFSGGSTTLSVTATESTGEPLHYQWSKNGVPFGTDSPTVNTGALTSDTEFSVTVNAGVCYTTSSTVVVTICPYAQTITAAPDQQSSIGQSVTLTGIANDGTNEYLWYQGTSGDTSQPLTGWLNTNQLTIAPAVTTSYWYKVRTGSCISSSGTSTVYVCVPQATSQPSSQMINPNATATLAFTANTPGMTYQWYTGAPPNSTAISGATGSSYTTPPLTTQSSYWCRATSTCSRYVDSNVATITICQPPAVTMNTVSYWVQRGSGNVTLTATGSGTNITWQWYIGNSGDTSQPINFATGSNYVFTPFNTTTFWVRVSGTCGTANSSAVTISVCAPPSIDTQPSNPVIQAGQTAALSVAASDVTTTPLTYQWYIGNSGVTTSPISGATGAAFTTPVLNATTSYWVRVFNGTCTAADSATATVTVCQPPPAPANQNASVGQSITLSGTPSGGGSLFMWFQGNSGDTSHPLSGWLSATTFTVSPTVTTNYWYQLQSGNCTSNSGTGTVFVCVPTFTTQPAGTMINSGQTATLTAAANTSGVTYQWYSGTSPSTASPISGATSASYTTPALTSQANYWVRATGTCGRTADSNTATVSICQPPSVTMTTASQWIARGNSITLSASASGSNISYQWYIGASGVTTSPINGATSSTYAASPQNTTSYWVRVTGTCGSANSTAVTISVCAPPTITTQPSSPYIQAGQSTTLSVVASEVTTTPVTYQWYTGNSSDTSAPISGATNASYTTPALNVTTNYWVRALNGTCTAADSTTAVVTVCPAPSAPGTYYSSPGQSVTLSGTPTNGSYYYRWYQGNSGDTSVPLTGWLTSSSYAVSPTVTTNYWYQFQNGNCISNSATGTVNVCVPQFTTQPQSVTITSGSSTTLTVAANTPGVTYQWYTGASGTTTSPISGATGTSLTVTPAATTSYWARATSTCSRTADSATATVTLCTATSIDQQPSDTAVPYGYSAGAQVWTSGSNLTYQWYQGESGDTTHPFSGATARTFSTALSATIRVWVRVSGTCGTVNSRAVWFSVYPTISQHPADVDLATNATARLTVTAGGSLLHYTWRWSNGTAVAGAADSPALITPSISTTSGIYCDVSSGTAITRSNEATLTVCSDLYAGPASASGSGSCRTLSVPTSGGAYYDVYWYRGVRGDTTNQLQVAGPSVYLCPGSGTATYWARVYGYDISGTPICGYADSQAVTVTIP